MSLAICTDQALTTKYKGIKSALENELTQIPAWLASIIPHGLP